MATKQRRAKRPLLRVSTGCFSCRARKKKCDERKPTCMGCVRNRLRCQWPENRPRNPSPQPTETSAMESIVDGTTNKTVTCDSARSVTREVNSGVQSPPQLGLRSYSHAPLEAESHAHDNLDQLRLDLDYDISDFGYLNSSEEGMESPGWLVRQSLNSLNEMIPAHPEFMPQLDHSRFSLFGHYIQTTANSMANGATNSNPFLVQLLPLTVSSELVLESILVQSCAHRAVRTPEVTGSEALVLYNKSLRSLRSAIDNIATQKNKDVLALVVSMLILCFTETARGDVMGSIFYHLQATGSLLPNALIKLKTVLPKDLRDFLIEYYIYAATLSMVSTDEVLSPRLLVCSDLLEEGQNLVESGYIGNLCGCWLELLLMIPRVFYLGCDWRTQTGQMATPEQVTTFALIQSQLTQWEPSLHAPHDVALVGRIFQQAVVVYLYGILGEPTLNEHSIHATSIQDAVTKAMFYLDQLPPSNQINTSLCWPLAVIGTCAIRPQQQESIRLRLDIMARNIGLGNIIKTRELLEYVWLRDPRGPWELSKTMQAAQLWISFA